MGKSWEASSVATTMFVERHRRCFTRRPTRDEKMNSLLDLPIDECTKRRLVETSVVCERSDERCPASSQCAG
jgi:hypothetical protein